MIGIIDISLENEMDLVLAHKRSMKVAEKIGLTTATQTTFATAVSEIARAVIEHTDKGMLYLEIEQNKTRYSLLATITYEKDIRFNNSDSGYFYAQRLVPDFVQTELADLNSVQMRFGIPRSLRLDANKITLIKNFFIQEEPINAYEEIKLRNKSLNKLAEQREEELRQSRIIDEKKTEFISVASHEIKTPITVIKAYTQLAQGLNEEYSPQLRSILNKVDVQTTKLLSLVQQLLDISRIENGNLQYIKEPIELNEFVLEMADISRQIYPHHVILTELCCGLPVLIDRIRMEQVFSNLLGNAAKYSKKNTNIIITCTRDKNGDALITVKDEGIGMSPDTIQSIFNKFYRDKDVIKTHSGLGMGLFVASKIIIDHGGAIWVNSALTEGSSFYFTLPAIAAEKTMA